MLLLNKQKIAIAFTLYFLLSANEVFACGCAHSPNEIVSVVVKDAVKSSTMVFAGTVIGFEFRKGIPNEYIKSLEKDSGKQIDYETKIVKFQVEQWWKGEATTEVFLVTDETKSSDGMGTGSSCDYHFKEGENYLVFAYGNGSELQTYACTRTKLLTEANEDLEILGKGKQPFEKTDNLNGTINLRQKLPSPNLIESSFRYFSNFPSFFVFQ